MSIVKSVLQIMPKVSPKLKVKKKNQSKSQIQQCMKAKTMVNPKEYSKHGISITDSMHRI